MSTPTEGGDEEEVVLRKAPKSAGGKCPSKLLESFKDGERRVKWSESTDLREKMKEYRRSQLSMTLDYHHIAAEEHRERAGVQQWRDSLQKHQIDELDTRADQAREESEKPGDDGDDEEKTEESQDSSDGEAGEFHPAADEDLELKVRVIKAESTKHTWLPAYRAAVDTYEPWLSEHIPSLPTPKVRQYEEQCQLYSQVHELYKEWTDQDKARDVDSRFDQITALLDRAKDLGDPPDPVAAAINKELTNPSNVQQQTEMYERMVNQVVTSFAGGLTL